MFCSFISADSFGSLTSLVGGTWKMKNSNGYSCEKWVKISDSEMASFAFDIKGRDTTVLERVRLINKRGIVTYNVTGAKSGEKSTFKLTSVKNKQFIFEDPKHDFPQRIIYHFIKPNYLHAWIDGKYNGKYQQYDFYYNRVK